MILNKEGLDSKIRSIGYSLGCYDDSINALLQESIGQIIDALTGDDTSIFFEENSTLKVVEVMYVNQEVDLYLYDAVSYFEKYENLEEALDVGTINDEQYREIKEAVEWQGGINLINDENRIKILNFLQWNDRHGCYTDGNCDLEEVPRFTYDEAVKYFFGVINDVFYYSKSDNIFELSYAQVIEYAKENGFYDKTYMKLNELLSNPNPTDDFYYSLLN